MLAAGGTVELTGLDGLLVYRDHVLDNQFYYTSARPKVARVAREWQLSFVQYQRSVNGAAGALSCVVDLQPSQEQLDALDVQLRARCKRPVTLTPIRWTVGRVAAVMCGGTPIVSVPSLIGRNTSLLRVDLSADQYAVLDGVLRNRHPGTDPNLVSMVYSLSYDAMRTAYQGRIMLDQEKFRSWAQTRCSIGLPFLDIEWSETFEELRSVGAIQVELINSTDAEYPQLRGAFMRNLEGIMGAEPQFARPPQGEPGWVLGFSCQKLTDEQHIRRTASVNLQVQAAESQTIFLQAPLEGFLEAVRTVPRTLIDTGIGFTQQVTFRCVADFDTEYLRTVVVYVSGAERSSHAFDSYNPQDWQTELTYGLRDNRTYAYTCDLLFADGTVARGDAVPVTRDQAFIFVVAAEYFTLQRYSVQAADDFPWQLIRTVRVAVAPPPDGKALPAMVELSDRQRSGGVDVFVQPAWVAESLPYHAEHAPLRSGRPFNIDGQSIGTTIFLNSLEKREVAFQADESYDWTNVASVDVDVKKPDGALTQDNTRLPVLPAASDASTFTYWYWKPEQLALQYQVIYTLTEPPTEQVVRGLMTDDTRVALPPPPPVS